MLSSYRHWAVSVAALPRPVPLRSKSSVGMVTHLTPEGASLPPTRVAGVDNTTAALALAPVPLGAQQTPFGASAHELASLARSSQRYSDDDEAGGASMVSTTPTGEVATWEVHAVATGLMRSIITSLGRVCARWLGDWG